MATQGDGERVRDPAGMHIENHWGKDLADLYSTRSFGSTLGFGRRPAVLVVDMANAFTDPSYRLGAAMDETVAAIAELLGCARAASLPIIYAVSGFTSPPEEIGMAALKIPALAELRLGTMAVEIDRRLTPRENDLVVIKKYWSSFMMTNLLPILVYQGIDTLIITGTLTNCCCESTARDAMQMNYKIIFVADANAALTDAAHNATLENMLMLFADVMTTREVIDTVRRAAA